jgi:hypothetical protein
MAQNRPKIPQHGRTRLHHPPHRGHHSDRHLDPLRMLDVNSKRFRVFFIASIVIVCVLIGIGFAEIHTTATALHTLVVHNGETALESAKTRIATVSQRCDLTHKIIQVLVKDDPHHVHSFQVSYRGCEKQLAEVKQIFAKAAQ